MKTFSVDREPPPIESAKAWSYLVTNLLVLPGLGSVMAGRKSGYFQMLLAVGGFLLTLVALVQIVFAWAQEFLLPARPALYISLLAGLAIFLVSWLWSLYTSLALFRRKP